MGDNTDALSGTNRFHTTRLTVRDLRADDAEAVFGIWGDPEVMRYTSMDVIESLDRARVVVANLAARYGDDGLGWWAAAPIVGGPAVALCCLQRMPDGEEIEIGYYVRRDRWREGFGTEIARGLIEHARVDLGLRRIVAVVRAENAASRRVLEKAGMRHAGTTDYRNGRPEKYVHEAGG